MAGRDWFQRETEQAREILDDERNRDTGRRFATVEEMQRYVDDITSSPFWRTTFPDAPRHVAVQDGRGSPLAWATDQTIKMPCSFRTEHTVLHELAHIAAPNDESHGDDYIDAQIRLNHQYRPGKFFISDRRLHAKYADLLDSKEDDPSMTDLERAKVRRDALLRQLDASGYRGVPVWDLPPKWRRVHRRWERAVDAYTAARDRRRNPTTEQKVNLLWDGHVIAAIAIGVGLLWANSWIERNYPRLMVERWQQTGRWP